MVVVYYILIVSIIELKKIIIIINPKMLIYFFNNVNFVFIQGKAQYYSKCSNIDTILYSLLLDFTRNFI